MRTEKEMLDLILNVAMEDDRIRGVYIEGSRVNPEVPKDIFQDYDIVYVVGETQSFREDRTWIDRFGERLYMQYPEEGPYQSSDLNTCYGWLMQFADGNRLDLHVFTLEGARENLAEQKPYRVLLDKDGILPAPRAGMERVYWVKRPSQMEFRFTCNEFWWCLNNVSKGLWREELPYVLDMLDFHIRPMLRRLLEWKIGEERDFRVSVGKSAKYMKNYLSEELYERYMKTYSHGNKESVWKAVFRMCDLFEETAEELSEKLGFYYDDREAANSRTYLEHVYNLPEDATEIFE